MFSHLLIACVFLAVGRLLLSSWEAGGLAASAWALAREITQAEYRWIERFGNGLRENMPWWGGLDFKVWQYADPWVDLLAPIIFSFLVCYLTNRLSKTQAVSESSK